MKFDKSTTYRITFLASGLVISIIMAIFVLLPYVVSSELVHQKLEKDIAAWTGSQVKIIDPPQISFWPSPSIVLHKVSLRSHQFKTADPLIYADKIEAKFSLISAIRGKPEFRNFHLIRPTIKLEILEKYTSWHSLNGRVANTLSIVKLNKDEENTAVLKRIPAYSLGTIHISDGTLSIKHKESGLQENLTAVNLSVDWPKLNGSGQITGNAIMRGELINVEMRSDEPIFILARRVATIEFLLKSKPLNLEFSGKIGLADNLHIEGKLAMDSPSIRHTLNWSGAEITPNEAIGALAMEAGILSIGKKTTLDDMIITLDKSRGIGLLEIDMKERGLPKVSGTLAFNRLNFYSFLRAFSPLPITSSDIGAHYDTGFLKQLKLDLRLSASNAALGQINMSDIAASVRVANGHASFDIGDATAYGGSFSGRLEVLKENGEGRGVITLSTKDTNLGAFYDALKLKGLLPRGKGSLSLALSLPTPIWSPRLKNLDGEASISITDGHLPDLVIEKIQTLSVEKRFFDVQSISGGNFDFSKATINVKFVNGQAEISKAYFANDKNIFELSGIIPYEQGSLALVGALLPPEIENNTGETTAPIKQSPTLQFFIGGSWPTPVLSPIISAR